MSESGDFDPGPWAGHDFASAYSHYDAHVGRSYSDAVSVSKPKASVFEPFIRFSCTNPLVIFVDVTGSMGEWPKVIFSKLPYLELEAQEYLGKDLEIAFGAFGDACRPDRYPLQVRPCTKGTDLKTRMEELIIEKGGGGTLEENSELAALYGVHKIEMPKAIKPVFILITDEKPYGYISKEMAADVAGVTLEGRTTAKAVFDQLKAKFSVYLIRKPYGSSGGDGNSMSSEDREVRARWIELLGEDRVCDLPEAGRVVDVIFGLLARETGRIEYFREEIEGRQKPDQVATVYKSLASIHKLSGPKSSRGSNRAGASILKIEGPAGGRSRRLLGE